MGIWDGYQEPTPTPVQVKTKPQSNQNNGGVAGWLYDTLVKPTVGAVGGAISDVPKIGESLYNLGRIGVNAAQGDTKGLNKAVQDQNKTLSSSNFVKNFTNATGPNYNPTDITKNLEQSLGKATGQVLDITAPVAGVGTTGAKSLAKLGVKLGAAQGASNAMERGNGAEDVVGNALTGGAVGGATGFLGGGVGKLLGKVTGAPGKVGGIAENFGVKEGLNTRASQAKDFANVSKGDLKNAMSYTKGGEPLGLNGISDHLRGLGMEPNSQNMKLYADTVLNKVGGHMQDMLGDVKVPVGSPADVGRNYVVNNAGTLGGLKSRSGAATDTMQQIRTLTEGLGSTPTAPEVLGTISKLESAASSLSKAAQNGDRVAVGQQGAYKAVANHLRDALSKHQDVNAIINDFKMPSAGSELLRNEVTNQGGTDQLSNHVLDTLNNAKTYQDLKSAMQPAMVAKDLAGSAEEAAQNTVPKPLPGSGGNGMGDLSTVYETGALMRGNPAAAVPLLGKVAGGVDKLVGKAASKVNPQAYQSGVEVGLKGGTAAGSPSNVVSRLAGAKVVAPTAALAAADTATTPQPAAPVAPDNNLVESGMPAGLDTSTEPQTTSPYSQENMLSDIQRDPKHMSDYLALFKALNPTNNTANAAQQKNLLAAKNANSTLQQIESSFNQAGGGQGIFGGTVSNLLGEVGANSGAKTYNDTATALAASLYKALGNTGTITDRDQAMISKLIPKTTDTSETAQNKVSQLESLLAQAQQNAMTPKTPSYGDNTALLQSLGAQ